MRKTVITHPDGTLTTITQSSSSGCCSGCWWLVAIVLLVSACSRLTWLIPLTVVMMMGMFYAVWRQRNGRG